MSCHAHVGRGLSGSRRHSQPHPTQASETWSCPSTVSLEHTDQHTDGSSRHPRLSAGRPPPPHTTGTHSWRSSAQLALALHF